MATATVKPSRPSTGLTRFIPILSWLPRYDRSWLSIDIIAGLTLWGLVVPEMLAYAGIAGLPPQAGLYALLAGLLVYALLGTSRQLVVAGTSATAAVLASAVTAVLAVTAAANASDPQTYQTYAAAFVLVSGLVFLVAGLARLGFITQFLSKPVMDGFMVGLALFVIMGQLNKLFGVPKPDGNTVQKFFGIIKELPQTNWATFAVGAGVLALLFLLPRWNKKIPAGLIALFGSIALSAALDLNGKYGVEIVGALPQGLPSLKFPQVPFTAYLAMILPAMGLLLVAYSEALGNALEYGERHGYEVNPNQELNAHGVANLVSGLLGGMIAGGSTSAAAVNDTAGARTQVSGLVTWVATIITLLFLTPFFTNLPEAVLGALIIHAIWHILAARKLKRLRAASRLEFWFGVFAMVGVLLLGVLQGMVIGVVASLLFVVYRTSQPHVSSLGRVAGVPGAYSDLERHAEDSPVPGVLIVRVEGQMYYANALTIRDRVKTMVAEMETPPRAVILDSSAWYGLDVTSVEVLEGLVKALQGKGIAVYLADVHSRVLADSRARGLFDVIGQDHIFSTLDAAVQHIEAQSSGNGAPASGAPG